ncbi:MAG: hypothetical protein WCQ11_04515 [Actinomycetes bacterium]
MTGLLYLIVIVMWAVVLIPIWLKSHDQAQVEKGLRAEGELSQKWRWQQRTPMSSRQLAFVRRRRVLMALLTALVASVVATAAGAISAFWIAAPVMLISGFAVAATKSGVAKQSSIRRVSQPAAQTSRTHVASPAHSTEAVSIAPATKESKRSWTPVETPLPSYVNAAKATAYNRVLDSEKPWTGQDMVDQAELVRAQRAERMKEAQKRLEEARAIAMEKARKAALAAQISYPEVAEKRAVNE